MGKNIVQNVESSSDASYDLHEVKLQKKAPTLYA